MFPIVRYVEDLDANGRNWPGLVLIRKGIPFPAAVVAQEVWESTHKMNPLNLFSRVFLRNDDRQREFEFMGHEVEVQARNIFYNHDLGVARHAEALSMKNGYDGLFGHLTVHQIKLGMLKNNVKARDWVREHWLELLDHK